MVPPVLRARSGAGAAALLLCPWGLGLAAAGRPAGCSEGGPPGPLCRPDLWEDEGASLVQRFAAERRGGPQPGTDRRELRSALAPFAALLPEASRFLLEAAGERTARALSGGPALGALRRLLGAAAGAAAEDAGQDGALLRLLRAMDELERSRPGAPAAAPAARPGAPEGRRALHGAAAGAGAADACAQPPPRGCAFYADCLERRHPCGEGGYALDYGEVYCERFAERFGNASGKLEKWTWATMQCLQSALVPLVQAPDVPCNDIVKEAFKSHAPCYTDNGVQSICDLSLGDMLQIASVPDTRDLLRAKGLWQITQVLQTCVKGLFR